MRIDLHTHSIFSDGELVPAELVRRAMDCGHSAIAITDHVDMTNVDIVVPAILKAVELSEEYIKVIPGVEITHVPPKQMDKLIKRARELGASWIVVHGETVSEPVISGTNLKAVSNPDVDVLAHPGFITEKEAQKAVDNNVFLEITGRNRHNITNGHVVSIGRSVGAKFLVNSDGHGPGDLMNEGRALVVARGAGLSDKEAKTAVNVNAMDAIRKL